MAEKVDNKFVWALSFLDLFTCALGAVFMLTILSVRERADVEANDPGGFFFVTARYPVENPLTPDERMQIGNAVRDLPRPFVGDSPLTSDHGTLVIISARIPYGEAAGDIAYNIALPRKPVAMRYSTETSGTTVWSAGDEMPAMQGRGYAITISAKNLN